VTLGDLVAGCPKVKLDAGSELRSGDLNGASLLAVDKGLVILRSTVSGSARRTITCHAGAGALVLPPQDSEALAALTDAKLAKISQEMRDRLLELPEAAGILLDGLADTLRQKHATIASMSQLHRADRIRDKLLELARLHGRVGPDEIRLDFPLTHELLGEMTGLARETVTRALDEMQREGFIVRRGRTYSLQVPPQML
jgi:CRP-like cAMP-binding protein